MNKATFNPNANYAYALRVAALAPGRVHGWTWDKIIVNAMANDRKVIWTKTLFRDRIVTSSNSDKGVDYLVPIGQALEALVEVGVLGFDTCNILIGSGTTTYHLTQEFDNFVKGNKLVPLLEVTLRLKGTDISIYELREIKQHGEWMLREFPEAKEHRVGNVMLSREELKELLDELEKRRLV